MAETTPEKVLETLKAGASARTQRSLDVLHAVCKEQAERGGKDFSIATIARLSEKAGGVSDRAIRNPTGLHYRALIEAWANQANGQTKRVAAAKTNGPDGEILAMIPDPSVRAMVGILLAERRKLLAENTRLKANTVTTSDLRETLPAPAGQAQAELLPPVVGQLLPMEIEALESAISEETMARQHWVADRQSGKVTKGGLTVFKSGFVTGLEKILQMIKSS